MTLKETKAQNNIKQNSGFDFLKCCHENLSFKNLSYANKGKNLQPNKFFPPIGQYISQSYWKKLLSKTTILQAQPAFFSLNSAILTVSRM